MELPVAVAVALVALPVGSLLNRLIVREPGYVITDPRDLPEGADESLLDELEPTPELEPVPVLALLRPRQSWRRWFPVVEVMAAVVSAITVLQFDGVAPVVAVLFAGGALLTLAAVDFRVYRIPDRLNFPSMAIGFALLAVASIVEDRSGAILGAAFGGFAYAFMLFLAHVAYPRGMGWGDVKLAWLMGFYLGWAGWDGGDLAEQLILPLRLVLYGAAAGSLAGVIIGGMYAAIRRSTKVVFPYGPSLALGCMVTLWFATEVV